MRLTDQDLAHLATEVRPPNRQGIWDMGNGIRLYLHLMETDEKGGVRTTPALRFTVTGFGDKSLPLPPHPLRDGEGTQDARYWGAASHIMKSVSDLCDVSHNIEHGQLSAGSAIISHTYNQLALKYEYDDSQIRGGGSVGGIMLSVPDVRHFSKTRKLFDEISAEMPDILKVANAIAVQDEMEEERHSPSFEVRRRTSWSKADSSRMQVSGALKESGRR